jgi:hypothetical protein
LPAFAESNRQRWRGIGFAGNRQKLQTRASAGRLFGPHKSNALPAAARHAGCFNTAEVRIFPGQSQMPDEEETQMLGTILLVLLILALIGSIPVYPYSANWGYYPSGLLSTLLLVC